MKLFGNILSEEIIIVEVISFIDDLAIYLYSWIVDIKVAMRGCVYHSRTVGCVVAKRNMHTL